MLLIGGGPVDVMGATHRQHEGPLLARPIAEIRMCATRNVHLSPLQSNGVPESAAAAVVVMVMVVIPRAWRVMPATAPALKKFSSFFYVPRESTAASTLR